MAEDPTVTVDTILWRWTPEPPAKASWYFLTVTGEAADAIRARAFELKALGGAGGFGSVRVQAAADDVPFATSAFPHRTSGGYLIPVKADVRKRAGIGEGDQVRLDLWL